VSFSFLGTERLIKGVSLVAGGRCEAAAVLDSREMQSLENMVKYCLLLGPLHSRRQHDLVI